MFLFYFNLIVRIITSAMALILLVAVRGRGPGNFKTYDGLPWDESLSSKIAARIRRKKACNKCRKWLVEAKNIYQLKNDRVKLIYNVGLQAMILTDKGNSGKSLTVFWDKQEQCVAGFVNNLFNQIFDYICTKFNNYTTYNNIALILKRNFIVEEVLPAKANEQVKKPENPYIKQNEEVVIVDKDPLTMIDINTARAEELSKLPGISIIMAKKAIQYRTKNNGFKTIDEFFEITKLKPHFRQNIYSALYAGKYKKPSDINSSDGRIIDF